MLYAQSAHFIWPCFCLPSLGKAQHKLITLLGTKAPLCGLLTSWREAGYVFGITVCSFWKTLPYTCGANSPNICKDIFSNIYLQIFWRPPSVTCFPLLFIKVWKDFFHRWCKGCWGLGLAARQLKCPGNIHQIPTNILPDGWCVFGQLNMYNWGVKNVPDQPTEH